MYPDFELLLYIQKLEHPFWKNVGMSLLLPVKELCGANVPAGALGKNSMS